MQSKLSIPDRLTDFGIQHVCETGNPTADSSRCAKGRTPLELITRDTPDISKHLDFGFCNHVQHRLNAGLDTPKPGRWLRVSHQVRKLMSCWILPQSGTPVSVTTVQRATNLEKKTDEMKRRMDDFQLSVQETWGARTSAAGLPPEDEQNVLSLKKEDNEFMEEFNRVIKSKDSTDSGSDLEPEEFGPDDLLNMEVGTNLEEQDF